MKEETGQDRKLYGVVSPLHSNETNTSAQLIEFLIEGCMTLFLCIPLSQTVSISSSSRVALI